LLGRVIVEQEQRIFLAADLFWSSEPGIMELTKRFEVCGHLK